MQATFDMELKHAEADEKKARDLLGHASFERDKAIRKLKRGYVALEKAQVHLLGCHSSCLSICCNLPLDRVKPQHKSNYLKAGPQQQLLIQLAIRQDRARRVQCRVCGWNLTLCKCSASIIWRSILICLGKSLVADIAEVKCPYAVAHHLAILTFANLENTSIRMDLRCASFLDQMPAVIRCLFPIVLSHPSSIVPFAASESAAGACRTSCPVCKTTGTQAQMRWQASSKMLPQQQLRRQA